MPFNIGGYIYNGGIADPQDYLSIVTRGLVMHLDASSPSSYPTTGTTWSDISGNSNNGTLTNGPTFNSGNGGSIVFDGTNDYVGFSGTGGILSGLSNASMAMWVNLTRKSGGGTQFQQIAGWRNDSTTDFFFLLLDSSGATVNTEARVRTTGGTAYDINADFTTYFGNWAYVVFTVSTNRMDLYINGNNIGSNTNKAGSFTNPGNDLRIGQNLSGTFSTQGNIANFTFYNRTLAAAEITQNYNVQRSRFGI